MTPPLPTIEELRAVCKEGQTAKVQECFRSLVSAIATSNDKEAQSQAKSCVLDIAKDVLKEKEEITNILVDVIWLEASMMVDDASSPYPESILEFLKSLVEACPQLQGPFVETLDSSLLQKAGIVESEAELQKKIRVTNTQQYYRQHKFNLLVEESEGFSKFLHTIVLIVNQEEDVDNWNDGCGVLLRLIGTFSLDPNRCLDILLDVLERELQSFFKPGEGGTAKTSTLLDATKDSKLNRILRLIEGMALDKLPALLAFKLSQQTSKETQRSVLRLAALLVGRNVLDLAHFLTFLPEWADVVQKTFDASRKLERTAVRALGRVRLTSSNKKDEETKKVDLSPVQDHLTTQLLIILLEWNQFQALEILFRPYWSMLCCLFPERVGSSICDNILECVNPLYNQVVEGRVSMPWTTKQPIQNNGAASVNKGGLLEQLLAAVVGKLEYTKESGCILLRPALYTKICRLLGHILETEEPTENCLKFLKTFLLPSLSLFKSNPCLSRELWKIVERLQYKSRYSLYSSWRGTGLERDALLSDKPLWLIEGEILAGKEAKGALKRLSKDTIRDACRAIAKVCHSHPLVVFSNILGQIESYDNLVQVVVDALRFVTPLSLDVLGFCILSRLDGTAGGGNRSRLKDDGVNVSQWLQSLESFIGALYKHFPTLELGGIMSYLMGRVSSGHVMELGVLRTLLKESGGFAFADYSPAASLSDAQMGGRAGSTLLKRETMSFGVFQRFSQKASASVRQVLLDDDVGVKLLILLSQIPNMIIFAESKPPKPVKLIANLVDTCQVTTAILLAFLTDESGINRSSQDFSSFALSLPSLAELHHEYELDVASAWMLARPLIRASQSDNENNDKGEEKFLFSDDSQKSYDLMLSKPFWEHISPSLFEVFYTNTLYDIVYPEDSYKVEIDRLQSVEQRLKSQTAPSFSQTPMPGNAATGDEDAKAAERCKRTASLLLADMKEQKIHVASLRDDIARKAKDFFAPDKNVKEAATLFFCNCVYPRCMKGPDDALYSARFLLLLHELEVPGFSTIHLFDILIVASSKSLFGLTEGEAANVSILLLEVWKTLSRWRYDEDAFSSELEERVGSRMASDGEAMGAASISHKRYSELYNKWHAAIGSTALGCLQSKEYIHARNALVVLSRIVNVYPTRPRIANQLLNDLQPMQDESYPFADLRASAQAYSTQLLKARDEGVWKEESAEAVKARQVKEKAAAAARQRKAEEQMEQIKLDSEKITEEIGEKEEWGRDRDRRGAYRTMGQDDGRRGLGSGPPPPESRDSRATPTKSRGSGGYRDSGGAPNRDDSWGRDRDRTPAPNRSDQPPSSSGRDPDDTRRGAAALEGRWQKAPGSMDSTANNSASRGAKRSRPPSPADPGEIQEEGPRGKRSRPDGQDGGDDRGKYRRRRRN